MKDMTLIKWLFACALLFGIGYAVSYVANKAMIRKGVDEGIRQLAGIALLAVLGIAILFAYIGDAGLFGIFSGGESISILVIFGGGGMVGWDAADKEGEVSD